MIPRPVAIAFLCGLVCALAVLNLSGTSVTVRRKAWTWWEHGWPMVCVERWGWRVRGPDVVPEETSPWLIDWPSESVANPLEIAVDLMVAVVLVVQCWRFLLRGEPGHSPVGLRFSIGQMIACTAAITVLCMTLPWARYRFLEWRDWSYLPILFGVPAAFLQTQADLGHWFSTTQKQESSDAPTP